MASKGKAPAKASSTRERGKILEERKALHERTIKFAKGEDTFEERILARGWGFMYEPSIPINLSWVREFYANKTKKDQREIFLTGRKITCSVSTIEKTLGIPKFRGKCGYSEISEAYNNKILNMDEVLQVIGKEGATWWENPHNPVIPARPKKKILNYEAWMWLKLVVCNINPTRHETTLNGGSSLDLCPYEGYASLSCFGHEICHECRSYQVEDSPSHISHVHHKWARDNNVPRLSGDIMWREDDEEVAPPVPPPAAPVDVPTPSAPSSPEPSRKELIRALRRNERIMRRHEQLMLMLHPGLDTSGLEQISSPNIS
ncbi:hypothetical protein PIB30_061445 [Stylosanthes scabra]|uniref:Putative plant transposon protein domain-containing protein n=1 Tax=Stylosanthes scabra TaxID=79078 RepID=A0ABU6RL68_9FABA|nr:hypothetical protein [Stylosanthes scabra]